MKPVSQILAVLAIIMTLTAAPAANAQNPQIQLDSEPLSIDEDVDVDFTEAQINAEIQRLQRTLSIEVPYRFQHFPGGFSNARIMCKIPTKFVAGVGDPLNMVVGYHESVNLSPDVAEGTVQIGGAYPPSDLLRQVDLDILKGITNITADGWQCYLDLKFSQWTRAADFCASTQYCDNINHRLINEGQF